MKRHVSRSGQNDLFDRHGQEVLRRNAPLADRMRPRTLEEFIGQEHIIGPGRLLRRAIQIDQLSSVIFYGPPGTGKTTLARIIANTTRAQFLSINAVLAGVKEIRDAIESAQKTLSLYGKRTILFIDEVHRFNKAQQDALLPHVENGVLILIGATTENPYFEVNKALVSRSRIFQLRQLTGQDLKEVARQALTDEERGLGKKPVRIDDDALDHLVKAANGDARGVLNALELAVETTAQDAEGVIHITRAIAEESIQKRAVLYDRDGDAHYDTISAFIKSVRGSDPDAALYWMAKMLYAGEDPRFIFRRLMILACEDIGLADPGALGIVIDCACAFDYVGLPEGRYHLAHACLYLATAPKSNSSMAFFDAIKTVSEEAADDVPDHLRDASRDGDGFGHGQGYLYPHAYRDHWVAQQYLPSSLQGKLFFQPSDQGYEKSIMERVAQKREAQLEAMIEEDVSSPLAVQAHDAPMAGSGVWLERTLSRRGEQLGRVRQILLDEAAITRASLVLDLHARTGLLTFEALRRAPEGSVWTLAHDDRAAATVQAAARGMDLLKQPQVVRTSLDGFDKDLKAAAGKNVRFDRIIGRNVLTREKDKTKLVRRCRALLVHDGVIVLAETVPSEGQRLAWLVSSWSDAPRLEKTLARAEEELFSDQDDPMVNWTCASLEKTFGDTAEATVTVSRHDHEILRRVTPHDIDFWLRETDGGGRLSLGDRICRNNDRETLSLLSATMHRRLDFKEVYWKNVTAIIKIAAHA
ncbi:MAG: AAA family ATPase [Chitinispirillaceae bacterium]|nr:AAA family ATPase [Chitinispirillaceae bacterium]